MKKKTIKFYPWELGTDYSDLAYNSNTYYYHTVDLGTRQHLVIQSSKTDIVVKSNMILKTQSKGFIQSRLA